MASPLPLLPKPPKENLTSHFILGEVIDHINLFAPHFPHVKTDLLRQHLWDIRNKNVDPLVHLRGFLEVFEQTDVYKKELEMLDEGTKRQIGVFVRGGTEEQVMKAGTIVDDFHIPPSPPVKHHFTEMAKSLGETLEEKVEGILHHHHHETNGINGHASVNGKETSPRIFEDKAETKIMEVYGSAPFQNWGQSIHNTPRWTFVPSTVLGLSNLTKWAKINHFRVRCSGYRHSWSSSFSEDKQILVSLLSLSSVNKLPDPMSIEATVPKTMNELKIIQVVKEVTVNGESKALCRIGVSVTNEEFRRWAVANDKWSLPVDVILVEVTIGGVNGPICHGAGINHKTINDYIRAVEYIDCNGVPRTISDPAHLKAAAGCFGLLGVVTHITFQLDSMTYAFLRPLKPDICLAIPPLQISDIPIAIRKTHTQAQYTSALETFKHEASTSYYSEYFWFTFSQQAWVNNFNTTPLKPGVIDYPNPFQTWCQWIQGWLGGIITANPIFNAFPGRWQATLLGTLGMINLPPFQFKNFSQSTDAVQTIKTALPNALHFRRGVQNMRVRDMEFQIPIPSKTNKETGKEEADWSIVQRAWWDVINLCYSTKEEEEESPMRLTLEMRIMGGSELCMAPQRGNGKWGTASIEVLSVPDAVSDGEWVDFLQRVADTWMGYRDEKGELLDIRPHWAKEWESVNLRGKPARQYLKEEAYKEAIPEFKAILADIGKSQGWVLNDLQARFSNELWDYMILIEREV